MNWTQEQWDAIHADNRTVLVSAAAGSGKTAVLVERVCRLIREGGDISRMLIVTFTRAAAAEMRERIAKALEQEHADPHMYRQSLMIGAAQISTIHTFCQHVIREHFEALGIDPTAAIADDTQQSRLMERAILDALEAVCEDPTEEEAFLLTCYDPDKAVEMAQKLRRFLMSLPDPWDWAERTVQPFDGPIADHPAFRIILAECGRKLETARSEVRNCFDILLEPGAPIRYEATVRADEQLVEQLIQSALDGTLRGGKARFNALPRGKKADADQEDPDVVDRFKQARDRLKDIVKDALAPLPEIDKEALSDDRTARVAAKGLIQLTRAVQQRYDELKNEKDLLDYHDLEHFCLKALRNEDVRRAVADSYDTVFIDEYQDVSAIQEAIISAIHQNNTLFLVGDVKQSIYGFRQADPSLFLQKYNTFSSEPDAQERRILLQNNFRSDRNVLAAVNQVFKGAMRANVTEIDYDESAMLYPAPDAQDGPSAEIHLLCRTDPETGEPAPLTDSARTEAELVAAHIRRLAGKTEVRDKNGPRPLRYKDIVILTRKAASHAALFAEVLQGHDIPVYSDAGSQYYDLPEVSDILHVLQLLDNPLQDIPLLAALRCPCFGFSDEELARIRLLNNKGSVFFHQVFAESAQEDTALGRRCRAALDQLNAWRELADSLRPEDMVRLLCDETGIYIRAGAQEDGEARQANLRLLAEKAAESENIADFLTQARQARSSDDSQTAKTLSDQEDVVRIMTMHKSKGLEFPVVFLVRLCGGIRSDKSDAVLADRRLGVALDCIDPVNRTKTDTLTKQAAGILIENRQLAEEARILYVAMTRAKEKLIMYGAPRTIDSARAVWQLPEGDIAAGSAGCMMDWIMQAADPALDGPDGEPYVTGLGAVFQVYRDDVTALDAAGKKERPPLPAPASGRWSEKTERLLSRELPESKPLKVSVSAIAKKKFEPEDEEETPQTKRNVSRETMEDRPRFMQDIRLTAAERGTAVHKALGLIDYAALTGAADTLREAVIKQMDLLVRDEKLTPAEREVLNADDLTAFFRSDAGRRALASSCVRREWSFNLKDGPDTVVQGVLDLCFLEGDEWVLVDYKTDRVAQAQTLQGRYEAQLRWYARALETLTGKKVKEALLYSVRLYESVRVI